MLFTEPPYVNKKLADECGERVVVLDIAFNERRIKKNGRIHHKFSETTQAFIDALGKRLVLWLDHHKDQRWALYAKDSRFLLYADSAPSIPPLITPDLVAKHSPIDTIVCHGDFDGIFAAIKWLNGGYEPYPGADSDSVVADTRVGEMSSCGMRYEQAIKACKSNDTARYAVIHELIYKSSVATMQIDQAVREYAVLKKQTEMLAEQYRVIGKAAYIQIQGPRLFDMSELLRLGQQKAEVAIVEHGVGNALLLIAGPPPWNFLDLFPLEVRGGTNRVQARASQLKKVLDCINKEEIK